MTAAERLIILGEERGQARMLLHQMEQKFGLIPAHYQNKIEKANSKNLLLWGKKLIEANNLESIFEE